MPAAEELLDAVGDEADEGLGAPRARASVRARLEDPRDSRRSPAVEDGGVLDAGEPAGCVVERVVVDVLGASVAGPVLRA